jgi:hypothetical protein
VRSTKNSYPNVSFGSSGLLLLNAGASLEFTKPREGMFNYIKFFDKDTSKILPVVGYTEAGIVSLVKTIPELNNIGVVMINIDQNTPLAKLKPYIDREDFINNDITDLRNGIWHQLARVLINMAPNTSAGILLCFKRGSPFEYITHTSPILFGKDNQNNPYVITFEESMNYLFGQSIPGGIMMFRAKDLLYSFVNCVPFSLEILKEVDNADVITKIISINPGIAEGIIDIPRSFLPTPILACSDFPRPKMSDLLTKALLVKKYSNGETVTSMKQLPISLYLLTIKYACQIASFNSEEDLYIYSELKEMERILEGGSFHKANAL